MGGMCSWGFEVVCMSNHFVKNFPAHTIVSLKTLANTRGSCGRLRSVRMPVVARSPLSALPFRLLAPLGSIGTILLPLTPLLTTRLSLPRPPDLLACSPTRTPHLPRAQAVIALGLQRWPRPLSTLVRLLLSTGSLAHSATGTRRLRAPCGATAAQCSKRTNSPRLLLCPPPPNTL